METTKKLTKPFFSMMDSRVHFTLLVLFAAFFFTAHCLSQTEEHVALFIFGDSTYDAGNNNYINTTDFYRASYAPYGETFFNRPTGRFSDGRLVSDFIGKNIAIYCVLFSIESQLLLN